MGTNYILHNKPDCECCGRPFEALHIGKSSGGWCFSLRVYPEDSINTLDDWRQLWSVSGAFIRNEYGERIPTDQMEEIITNRKWNGLPPNRHDVDGRHCVGHGPGTWDYIVGDFC